MGNYCSGKKQQLHSDMDSLSSKDKKDKQIGAIGMRAVGGGQDTISNEVLDLALGEMANLK